ncbi:MAG: hypothetical protein IKV32_07170 [Muribaculaceae bacterium]|nr:hypothetical protein [Muribaculaceae bacterium]
MRKAERKKYRIIILVVAIVSFILGRCSVGNSSEESANAKNTESTEGVDSTVTNNKESVTKGEKTVIEEEVIEIDESKPLDSKTTIEILNRKPDSKWDNHIENNDDFVAQPLETHFTGSRSKIFNDSNHVQLAAAEKIGIKPITNMSEAWNLSRPIKLIASCEEYYLDELTHSYPFLVPEAEKLLKEIGARFNQLLWERGKSKYRIKVTSVLRTSENIKELMKSNTNAIATSTHQYATTFDISYSKFVQDSAENPRTFADLSALLSEIIYEFHTKGRCYVKYEAKQSCFHLTVRP